uniref:Uncharacterized protein n=1 Tax=Megaselia scalaris TaxID=36166 RepID=T1H2J8_MEGSC
MLKKLHDSASPCQKPLTFWNVLVDIPAAFTQLMPTLNTGSQFARRMFYTLSYGSLNGSHHKQD